MTLKYIITPEERRKKFDSLLKSKKLIRGIEVHNAISALIATDLTSEVGDDNKRHNEFDFFWESSFTDSASKGHPDIEIVSFDSRLRTISEILDVTNKPMIVDGDTGGDIHHFEYLVPRLEKIGVSAVIIEDKVFPKRNSLDPSACQDLEDPDTFAEKIIAGKNIQKTDDFMIISRIESFIAGKDIEDALYRAEKYLVSGIDGIMIHSNSSKPDQILSFAERYKKLCEKVGIRKPLVCVPTTYNTIKEEELEKNGFNIVIYANHMLRASYKAMQEVGRIILKNERSFEAEPYISGIKEIFEKVGFMDIKEKDKSHSIIPSVIIPAAGENPEFIKKFGELPRALIRINDKTLLEHQIPLFKKFGLNDIYVITGYRSEMFDQKGVELIHNPEYSKKGMLHSLMLAKDKMNKGFIYVNSDILFDERLVKELLSRKEDIIIVIDNSYLYHKHEIDKKLDGVITRFGKKPQYQKLRSSDDEVILIGKEIPKELMTHEYVGMAKFSRHGAECLIKLYEELKEKHNGKFYESISFNEAVDTDMIQELIYRGFKVTAHETNGGWLEIHNEKDLDYVQDILKN